MCVQVNDEGLLFRGVSDSMVPFSDAGCRLQPFLPHRHSTWSFSLARQTLSTLSGIVFSSFDSSTRSSYSEREETTIWLNPKTLGEVLTAHTDPRKGKRACDIRLDSKDVDRLYLTFHSDFDVKKEFEVSFPLVEPDSSRCEPYLRHAVSVLSS